MDVELLVQNLFDFRTSLDFCNGSKEDMVSVYSHVYAYFVDMKRIDQFELLCSI
jgi:hypothetical protein